jgi:DNA polymerase-3 subunit gamma/tau
MFYTKYRPQKFSEVLKPNEAVDALVSEIKANKVAHAFLFVGSRGTGKTTTARILAKALNCLNLDKDGDPCDKCTNCLAVKSGNFVDLVEIDAASNRGIDDIRDLREKVRLAPSMGTKKVYIIDEVHMLSSDAFNAFLKTLEEPPANVVFILCTTEFHKVPETIKSRCQVFRFKRASKVQLIQKLKKISKEENIQITDEDLKKIASASMGGYRDAETLLQQVLEGGVSVDKFLSAGSKYKYLDFVDLLYKKDSSGSLKFVNEIFEEGIDIYVWVGELLNYVRGLLFVKSGIEEYFVEFGPETVSEAQKQAQQISFGWIVSVLEHLLQAQKEIRASFIPQLPLEIAVAKICIGDKEDNTMSVFLPESIGPVKSKSLVTNDIPTKLKEPLKNEKHESKSDKATSSALAQISEAVAANVEAEPKKTRKDKVEFINISLEEFQGKWTDLCSQAAKINNSVSALLRSSKLINIEGKFLVLEVSYSFHKERIESSRNRKLIEDVLKEVFSHDLSVKCVVSEVKKPRLKSGEVGVLTDINVSPVSVDPKAVLDMLDGGLPLIQNI